MAAVKCLNAHETCIRFSIISVFFFVFSSNRDSLLSKKLFQGPVFLKLGFNKQQAPFDNSILRPDQNKQQTNFA